MAVKKIRYRSGTVAYRVSGNIAGKRVRRFFATRGEAVAARDELELTRAAAENQEKVVTTSLTPNQVRDAQVAFAQLAAEDRKKPLSFYVKYALDRYKERDCELSLREVYNRYLNQKSWEWEKGAISEIQYRTIRRDVGRFVLHAGEKHPLAEIDTGMVCGWLEGLRVGLTTWNNKRGYLDAFFNYCVAEEWLGLNPVRRVKKYKVKGARGMAETLSPIEARQLMEYVERYAGAEKGKKARPGFMVPHFLLTLFAGIRADVRDGEIGRFTRDLVNLGTRTIHITPFVSKTNEYRTIHINDNLANWLERYPLEDYTHLPTRVDWHKRRIRRALKLGKNVLRHSFISYLVARDRSVGDAALQAGNTEDIVRRHYLGLRTKDEAGEFWGISPR